MFVFYDNAYKNSKNGWIIGDFRSYPLKYEEVEVKWGVHKPEDGEELKQSTQKDTAVSITVIV